MPNAHWDTCRGPLAIRFYAKFGAPGPGCDDEPSCATNNTGYGTFRLNFHRFDRFELDLRGFTQPWGAAFSCLRLKWADMVLI